MNFSSKVVKGISDCNVSRENNAFTTSVAWESGGKQKQTSRFPPQVRTFRGQAAKNI
jgi:hypothetical protein